MAMQFSDDEKKKIQEDNSEIYKKRTEETNDEEVKKLKGKDRRAYYRQYYLGTAVVAVIIVAVIVMLVRNAVGKKPTSVLYVAIENDVIDDAKIDEFEKSIEDYLGLDGKYEKVTVDNNVTDQQLQTYLYTGTADVVIASEDTYKEWAEGGYMMEPKADATVSFYDDYDKSEKFYSTYISGEDVRDSADVSSVVASDDTEYNYGLYLSDSKEYKTLEGYIESPVIGISAATNNSEDAASFVQYMMKK